MIFEMHKNLLFCFVFFVFINLRFAIAHLNIHRPNITEGKEIIKKIFQLRDTLNELASPYIKITVNDVPPNCVQMQCKVICFNGRAQEIEKDVRRITESTGRHCDVLDELRLYNYEFPNSVIPVNFLGSYTKKVPILYIANSNVTDFEKGAFGNGNFKKIYLENLKLICLRKDFFLQINSGFESLSVVQTETPLQSVCDGFLYFVQYKIKSLTLQVGIPSIRNVSASNLLLNNLAFVDFSHNNFGNGFEASSFQMLSRVKHLDLSHSKINYLPEYIFCNIAKNLEYLDLSFNNLKTISSNIFGDTKISSDLKLYTNDNNWDCTCELQQEMIKIYGQQSPLVYCSTPEKFFNWSIFDDEICDSNTEHTMTTAVIRPTSTTTAKTTTTRVYTTTYKTTTTTTTTPSAVATLPSSELETISDDWSGGAVESTSSSPLDGLVCLNCKRSVNYDEPLLKLSLPALDFTLTTESNLRVEVAITIGDLLDESYGLIWFSKVTTEFHKMEVNYNEYGLGCYSSISYLTTVDNLLPDVSYTFCLVQKEKLNISPFSCKSIHIPGNLGIRHSAWLTHDRRATGISLTVLGIVLFTLAGIILVFMMLKQKPTLLKGSKRVAVTKAQNEIIVLPRDRTIEDIKHKEEILAKSSSKSNIFYEPPRERRSSIVSNVSYQSYMNANLYEELPVYLKFDANFELPQYEHKYNYIPPISTVSSEANLVSYAEIPFKHKRTSNDPLPEVPKETKSTESPSSEALQHLESDLNPFMNYTCTFAYDSVV